ncbi:short-chain dehydrogenase [Enemella evansiae]|uniref:SDR family NAD(P)-dependent oxidoreductase n=1 Tax=Enemella evansiae TaxID=2016499 RepID=UPI000B974647|nr:SDR family oxidoreductase [Enemella evansiae]OYO00941.1 short-chain dehydrogenase [Enemella evansiae]
MTLTLITGTTAGLGRALAMALDEAGHRLILTGRDPERLRTLRLALPDALLVPGDVTDPAHRLALVEAVGDRPLDVLVHNASDLGPSPMVPLADLTPDRFRVILEANVVAPLALSGSLLPALRRAVAPSLVTISSDAAVEHYETWGGYAASKAALDRLAGTWAAEEPRLRAYAVDPGDMRTAMHQAAFPGEDISDRPLPEEAAVPGILALLGSRPASGRYRAAELAGSARTEGVA